MTILGIETSCDETSAGIVEKKGPKLELLSNVVASSLKLHAKTGGIIPEIAAREQIKFIIPVIKQSLKESSIKFADINAIAITYGPGLLGSLLIGVETAKALSFIYNKPLIPVNHLIGHIYANWIQEKKIVFPAIGLIVSGGHTDLILIKNHGNIKWLGGTRDDAAGEAFDKIGRLLGLPYPGGPAIEKMGVNGNPKAFIFPHPMIDSDDFDFSFSGLKTAVLREVQKIEELNDTVVADLSASVQKTVVDLLVKKTLDAIGKYDTKSLLLGGGVSANQKLRDELKSKVSVEVHIPPKNLCTDNGAMIAAAAFYNEKAVSFHSLNANPQLYF